MLVSPHISIADSYKISYSDAQPVSKTAAPKLLAQLPNISSPLKKTEHETEHR